MKVAERVKEVLKDGEILSTPEIRERAGPDADIGAFNRAIYALAKRGELLVSGEGKQHRYCLAATSTSRPAVERSPRRRTLPTLQPAATCMGDSRERPAAPPPTDLVPVDGEFVAAIDHRARIAVRAGGIGLRIEPADALDLLEFLSQQEEVIKAAVRPTKRTKR